MTATSTAEHGYRQNMASTKTARRAEYEVVAQVTHRLRETAQNARQDYPAYVQALHDNRKLWQVFALDVVDEKNPLPAQLKANIVYLAEFCEVYTSRILQSKVSVLPLLEINLAVMRGLGSENSGT